MIKKPNRYSSRKAIYKSHKRKEKNDYLFFTIPPRKWNSITSSTPNTKTKFNKNSNINLSVYNLYSLHSSEDVSLNWIKWTCLDSNWSALVAIDCTPVTRTTHNRGLRPQYTLWFMFYSRDENCSIDGKTYNTIMNRKFIRILWQLNLKLSKIHIRVHMWTHGSLFKNSSSQFKFKFLEEAAHRQ